MSKHYLAHTANELDEAVEKVLAGYRDVTQVTASAGDVRIGKKIVDATGAVKEGTLNTDDYYNEGYNKGLEEATPTLQSKEVIPSLVDQTIKADTGFDGLLSVFVQAVPKSILDAEYQKGYEEACAIWKPYKEELLYIQSSGTQYINTGVQLVKGLSAVIDYQPTSTASDDWFFSVLNTSGTTGWRAGVFQNAFYLVNFTASQSSNLTARTTFSGTSTNAESLNIFIFAENRNGSMYGNASGKMYSCKIYNTDGSLLRDYIPVLDWSNVPCLYDKVERKLYYNAGTGSFTYA